MVTKKVIGNLYKQFNCPPDDIYDLNIAMLFDKAAEHHGLVVDENYIFIGSVDPSSPFAMIPLNRINAIVEFDSVIAIVLHSSIIFLDKHSDQVHIHIKDRQPTLWDKMRSYLLPSDENDDTNFEIDPETLQQMERDFEAHQQRTNGN